MDMTSFPREMTGYPQIYTHAIPQPKTLLLKEPKQVMLFRVFTRGDNVLVNRMQLWDISNPDAATDEKLANDALLFQETHTIRLPKVEPLDHPRIKLHSWDLVRIATQALSTKVAPPSDDPDGVPVLQKHLWPHVEREDYYEPLHPKPDCVWRFFRDHPTPFKGDTHVMYKISYFGVDVMTSTTYPPGGRNVVQMDLNVKDWSNLYRQGHWDPRFKYIDNKLQLNGYEMFKGRVIYHPNKYPKGFAHGEGAGLQEPTGWSGWRLNLKEGQQIPEWHQDEVMYYNPDDDLIWQALEMSETATKWKGIDEAI
ncbi:hypothetical protein V8F20_011657 [Naviculisporaceae sp. PSN 640]